jgi:hypothetical protein
VAKSLSMQRKLLRAMRRSFSAQNVRLAPPFYVTEQQQS